MSALNELRAAHERGESTRVEYAMRMREIHAHLQGYSQLIKGTDIGSIVVRDDCVLMITREWDIAIECDPTDMGIPTIVALNFHHYEARDAALLFSLVEDGMTFYDVGANLGWYGLHVARRFPRCRVVAFEPVPHTFKYLRRNIGHNSLGNMQAYPYGLFDEAGERVFFVNPDMMGAASAARPTSAADVREMCAVRTLDSMSRELGMTPDFIKMDVEGAELMVLRGGHATLKSGQPIIFAEMLRKHAATFGYHPNEIISLLASVGYRCFTSRAGQVMEFLSMDENTIETNFVFLHAARHAAQIRKLAP
jgi:FkbM family methyltransferase